MDLANVLRSEENVKSSARLAREGLRMAKQMGDLEGQVVHPEEVRMGYWNNINGENFLIFMGLSSLFFFGMLGCF